MRIVAILLLFVLFYSCQEPTYISYIIDGDTYVTLTKEKIRAAEIDAPEKGQAYYLQAKEVAKELLLNKKVVIVRHGKDMYGRTIADVYTSDGETISQVLIKNGLAHITPWTKNPTLVWEYKKAKNNNIGLFQSPYEYPYIYRRKHKIK